MESPNTQRETAVVIEPTWAICAKIWWSLIWRFLIIVFPVSIFLGGIVGVIAKFVGFLPEGYVILVGSIVGYVMGVWVVKRLLKKKFKTFRIVLVSTLPAENI